KSDQARGDQQLTNGSVLEARHPTSCQANLTNRPAHDLGLELLALRRKVLTVRRLGNHPHPPQDKNDRSPLASPAWTVSPARPQSSLEPHPAWAESSRNDSPPRALRYSASTSMPPASTPPRRRSVRKVASSRPARPT